MQVAEAFCLDDLWFHKIKICTGTESTASHRCLFKQRLITTTDPTQAAWWAEAQTVAVDVCHCLSNKHAVRSDVILVN